MREALYVQIRQYEDILRQDNLYGLLSPNLHFFIAATAEMAGRKPLPREPP